MPVSSDTFVRIEDRQTLATQTVINAYHFKFNSAIASPDLVDLLDFFETAYVTPIVTAQVNDVGHSEIYAKQLNNGVVEATKVLGTPGARAGTPECSSFVAAGYKLARSTTDVRNGSKRLAGVAEEDIDGDVFNGVGLGFWAPLNLVLDAPLVNTDGTWTAVILSSDNTVPAGQFRYSDISGVVFNTFATSQVSRKASL